MVVGADDIGAFIEENGRVTVHVSSVLVGGGPLRSPRVGSLVAQASGGGAGCLRTSAELCGCPGRWCTDAEPDVLPRGQRRGAPFVGDRVDDLQAASGGEQVLGGFVRCQRTVMVGGQRVGGEVYRAEGRC